MTISILSPTHSPRKAWMHTTTWWGKVSVVLFYSFLWVQIVLSVQTIVFPMAFGADCFYSYVSDYARAMILYQTRGLNVFAIAALLYGHCGGIQVIPVAIISVSFCIVMGLAGSIIRSLKNVDFEDAPVCEVEGWEYYVWITVLWSLAALLTACVESWLGNRGTPAEDTPLM